MPDIQLPPVAGSSTSALDRGTRAKALLWLQRRGDHDIAQMLGLLPSPPPAAVSRGRRIAGGDR